MNSFKDAPLIAGTAGGTLASLLPNISTDQLFTTCIMAIVGATVSFGVTLLLKMLLRVLQQIPNYFFRFLKRK